MNQSDLVRVVGSLCDSGSLDELQRNFVSGFPRLLDAPMYGYELVDPRTGRPARSVAVNVSDAFVATYELTARDVDPILAQALDTRRPAYNRAMMSAQEWEASAVYRRAYRMHRIQHIVEVPMVGAKQVIEGESFLTGKQGKKVASPAITVADDVWHEGSVGIGFDFEGVPKQRVAVIDGGVATGPVTDWRTSRKLAVAPTGHGSGSSEFGPYASHLVLEAGDDSFDDLIAGVDDGFVVTRFHYVNILDRPSTLLTGMTRDGTFRVRGGELAEPVHNFRFAQGVLDALSSVTGVGRDVSAFAPDYGSFGCTVAPALRIEDFNFASTTSH